METQVKNIRAHGKNCIGCKKQNLGFYSLVAGAVGLCIAVEITF